MSKARNETQERYAIQEGQPVDWFESLYSSSNTRGEGVPWANMQTHPSFARWLQRNPLNGEEKSALVVGCGMGDDAITLESLGFQVTAFDVSETAIGFCKERFTQSKTNFIQADLLQDQSQWHERFDFVLEIFTVQALPPVYEEELIENISRFVAPGGRLLVIAEVDSKKRSFDDGPPWLLTPEHIDGFITRGLQVQDKSTEKEFETMGEGTFITLFKRP